MGRGRVWLRWVLLAGLALGGRGGEGQTLAHKNWEGSGLTAQAWWTRAVFCVAGGDLKRVAGEMDALERMGCDAVEVEPGSGYGAAAEMDGVMEAAGRRRMRVVVDLEGEDLVERVRFWGTRGAAGFAVRGVGVLGLRQAAGGRLLIGDGGQLQVRRIPSGAAAGLREWLAGMVKAGVLLEDGEARPGYARMAMLLMSGVAARVGADAVVAPAVVTQEFSAEEMLLWVPKERAAGDGMEKWVRELSALRRQSAALRAGSAVFLDFDALGVVGWTVPARDGRSAVVVVCNVGEKEVRVGLAGVVRGSVLKTLARSDGASDARDSLAGVGLGVDGVFVGEVR